MYLNKGHEMSFKLKLEYFLISCDVLHNFLSDIGSMSFANCVKLKFSQKGVDIAENIENHNRYFG